MNARQGRKGEKREDKKQRRERRRERGKERGKERVRKGGSLLQGKGRCSSSEKCGCSKKR